MNETLSFWPEAASAYAGEIDRLTLSLALLVTALSAPVFILITVFAVRFRRGKPADRSTAISRNLWLELSWAILPFLLVLVFYAWATALFIRQAHPPDDALEIMAVGKQWMWKFQHAGGQREINDLHVPAGRPVKIVLASQDVIHSLYIPALRIKQDAVPGRYTNLWFTADEPGVYRLVCAEFCGTQHSRMVGRFIVLPPGDYAAWLSRSDDSPTLAAAGAALFRKHGCSGCHNPNATVHAPDLHGLYGRVVALQSGAMVEADSQYIRDSILLPQSQIAAGYPAIMPTFRNVLDEGEVMQLVAYIKSLGLPEDRTQP